MLSFSKMAKTFAAALISFAAGAVQFAIAADLTGQTTADFIRALAPKTRGLTVGTTAEQPTKDMHIEFAFNSAELTDQARAVLDQLGAALQSDQLKTFQFSMVGHTDAVGSPEYNLHLSEQRANAVRDYLIQTFQIDPSRLVSSGVGEDDLFDSAHPDSGTNRRVVIVNIGA